MIKTMTKKIVKSFKEEYMTLGADDKRVAQLKQVEKAFKKAYRVKVEVKYIDAKHTVSMTGKKSIKGYHRGSDSTIVVFVSKDMRRTTMTLLHELTHAYQHQYMTKTYNSSVKQLNSGKVSYLNSWHERHARHTAEILLQGYIGKIAIEDTMSYAIAA